MEELYLETSNGNVLIGDYEINKYHLRRGRFSPFTCNRIVDKDGLFMPDDSESTPKQPLDDTPELEERLYNDGIVEMDNGMMLSTSEMIDIAQGADSWTEET